MVATIANNRWVRETWDFATRLGEKDLSGMFSKKIVIEEGTTGLLMIQGRYDQRLEPGEHVLEGGLGAVLGGKGKKHIVLVSLAEVALDIALPRLLTNDPVPFAVNLTVTLRFAPGRESVFLSNFMSSRDYVGTNELRNLVFSELNEGAQVWASSHTIKELAEDLSLRDELSITLQTHMQEVLNRYGLAFGRVEVKDFRCEIWDKSVNQRVETSLQVTEERAGLEGRKRLFDIAVETDIQDITEDTQKTATYEKRVQLWERLRRATSQDEMNKVQSEQDLEDFIRSADREKLLKEDEFDRFNVALREAGEDHERLRAHVTRIAEIEQEYDYKRIELARQAGLSREQLEGEMGLERLRIESQLETELKRVDLTLEAQRREGEHRRNEEDLEAASRWEREVGDSKANADARGAARESERLDAELGLALEEKKDAQDRLNQQESARIALEAAAGEQELALKTQEGELDLRLRELRDRHDREMESAQALDTLSLHTLIAVAEGEKAPLLADLAKTEALKDMSPEQIMAMASERNPELGGALAEMAARGDNEQATQMYERLLSEQKESASQVRESQREMTETMKEMFNKALETQSEVSKAFAYGGGQRQAPGAPAGAGVPGGQAQRVVVCRRCMQESAAGTKHCPNCGDSLMTS